jgi:hypothetical protein
MPLRARSAAPPPRSIDRVSPYARMRVVVVEKTESAHGMCSIVKAQQFLNDQNQLLLGFSGQVAELMEGVTAASKQGSVG